MNMKFFAIFATIIFAGQAGNLFAMNPKKKSGGKIYKWPRVICPYCKKEFSKSYFNANHKHFCPERPNSNLEPVAYNYPTKNLKFGGLIIGNSNNEETVRQKTNNMKNYLPANNRQIYSGEDFYYSSQRPIFYDRYGSSFNRQTNPAPTYMIQHFSYEVPMPQKFLPLINIQKKNKYQPMRMQGLWAQNVREEQKLQADLRRRQQLQKKASAQIKNYFPLKKRK